MKTCYWIWYPGDFELYHAMKQNFSRVERGYEWPAFWKSEGFRNRVVFRREYETPEETVFTVFSGASGHVLVGDRKYPFGEQISCGPGRTMISVHVGCIETFPSVYIKGEVVCSDQTWQVSDYAGSPVQAGYSRYFTDEKQNPAVWEYSEKICFPVSVEEREDGLLYEFETELTAVLEIRDRKAGRTLRAYCGESREEALDREQCYYSWLPDPETGRCPRCALRYVFVTEEGDTAADGRMTEEGGTEPDGRMIGESDTALDGRMAEEGEAAPDGNMADDIRIRAFHQYVDIPVRARFVCSDELINRIWSVAEHTFRLCSGIFFIDGIKRDKWIWGGDAYQSFFVNRYLMADADINRRTLLALRGNDPMTTHINTILDYTLYWILGIKVHYESFGDSEFVKQVFPKMRSLMEFCEGQLEEHGFIIGRPGDWIFIDWADMDKEGPLCAEQMLLVECYRTMHLLGSLLNEDTALCETYREKYETLKKRINDFYWDAGRGAYMDSFVSGRNHVTRHANIFAIIFDIADEGRKMQIVEHVLHNDEVAQITTPYFKFYEMDALCRMGYLEEVLKRIREYWGGMLERGAATFWEEYDPAVPESEQYDMYGDKFGKSLCHAWSASPSYLLARYFVGLEITDPARGVYELHPHLEYFESLDCVLPVGDKDIHIVWDGKELTCEQVR